MTGDPGRGTAPTDIPDTTALLEIAMEAAVAATELIHERRPDRLEVGHKSTATDVVTDMDLASEEVIRSTILGRRPSDVIIGEESSTRAGKNDPVGSDEGVVVWLVDPIDGTTNYLYDLPGYNISIAAGIGSTTLVGVVADPTHGRIYSAVHGGGAFCNGVRLDLRSNATTTSLERSLIATGFGYSPELRGRQGTVVAGMLPKVRDIRRFGAAALDLCHVAAGRVDGYFEVNLAPWDVAAGALIATEAGAVVSSIAGGPPVPGSIVAANPEIFDDLQALLVELGAGSIAP